MLSLTNEKACDFCLRFAKEFPLSDAERWPEVDFSVCHTFTEREVAVIFLATNSKKVGFCNHEVFFRCSSRLAEYLPSRHRAFPSRFHLPGFCGSASRTDQLRHRPYRGGYDGKSVV